MDDLSRMILDQPPERPVTIVYGVATGDNTVPVSGATTAVELPAIVPVKSGDYCAVLKAGADRVILGPVDGEPQSWSLTAIGQPGPVTVTTNYGWRQRLPNGIFTAQITMTVSGTGSAGSPIDIATPFTLDGTEAIGGSFTLFDTGNTIYAGSIYPSSTSLFRMQVSGNGNQLGQNPSFALASGDIIRATVHGRLA